MATKPFLKDEALTRAASELRPPSVVFDGVITAVEDRSSHDFSLWLQGQLLERLSEHPSWKFAGAVALGSWSRDELSPKSDIDLLFSGNESEVLKLVTDFAKQGLKLRYRMPEDSADWTKGVEPFDILALIGAKVLPGLGELAPTLQVQLEKKLEAQQTMIRAKWTSIRKSIVRAMIKERRGRAERFDSITNYLEPNLKYGSGGLRDLEQALALKVLFPERFESADDQHAFDVLLYYKRFFLLTRQKLHISEGSSDLLTAPEQGAIATWLGYKASRDFMKEIQKGVSRVSFYADWAFEKATSSKGRLIEVDRQKLETPKDLFKALKDDPSVLMQNRVRNQADRVFKKSGVRKELGRSKELDQLLGKELTSLIDPANPEEPLVALFRSRLIDHCVPEFRKIVGHVQHDQYHRFSVDAHILQALRELGRLRKSPRLAGRLAKQVESLSKTEWEILSFACLYHDIAKGRDGDHSVEGIAIAEHDLSAFGKSESLISEVAWIVEEHLILSSAAFKENPASPRTWAKLSAKGVTKRRIPLLAAFTIVDIRATNPDAWTPWKERLMSEVVTNLENPQSTSAIQFAKLQPDWVDRLDSFLVSMLPTTKLAADFADVIDQMDRQTAGQSNTGDLPLKVLKTRGGQTWIRFHSAIDRAGLFAHYVGVLAASGLGIRHASIHTFVETGVYDWFEVKTEKTAAAVMKLISLALTKAVVPPKKTVTFDEITLASQMNEEWVVSFRGKDQQGALLKAATALLAEKTEIQWARVHTWGRQIDDTFGIKPPEGRSPSELIASLKSRVGHV